MKFSLKKLAINYTLHSLVSDVNVGILTSSCIRRALTKLPCVVPSDFLQTLSVFLMTAKDNTDWADFPLFAPQGAKIPKFSSAQEEAAASPALQALSHILHDEETPEERSELYRDEGNRHFKRKGKQ